MVDRKDWRIRKTDGVWYENHLSDECRKGWMLGRPGLEGSVQIEPDIILIISSSLFLWSWISSKIYIEQYIISHGLWMLRKILLVVRGRRQWCFEWSYKQILCHLKFKNIMLLKIQKYTNNLSSFIFPEP